MSRRNKAVWTGFAVIAIVLGLGYWLWLSPIVGAADVRVHVRLAHSFYIGMMDSLSYPDWDATAYGGRGTPMPRFVGPLPLVLTSFFQLMSLDVVTAVKIVLTLFALTGLAGVYYWLAAIGLVGAFPWAALFFMVHPLVSFHLGVAFLFQNLCAYFLLPWLWYAASLVWREEQRAVACGALIMGSIALSHPYFALMVGYAWFFFMLVSWLITRNRRFCLAAFAVPFLALLFASPYLLPAMLTSGDVYYKELTKALHPGRPGCEFIDAPVIYEEANALSWWQALLELTKSPDETLPPGSKHAGEIMSVLQMKSAGDRLKALRPWLLLSLVLCFILAFTGSLRQDIDRGEKHAPLWLWLLCGSCCAIMTLRPSSIIYAVLPGAMAVQFPFRWLLPAFGLWIPLIAAGSVKVCSLKPLSPRFKLVAWLSRFLLAAVIMMGLFLQSLFWVLPIDSLNSFFASPGYLEPFYPRAVPKVREIPVVAGAPHLISIASGTGTIDDHQAGIAWFQAHGKAETPVELHVNTHFDPYWRFAMSDIGPVQPDIDQKNGTMLLKIPAGNWLLTMSRESPMGRSVGWALMLLSLVFIMLSARQKPCLSSCSPLQDPEGH